MGIDYCELKKLHEKHDNAGIAKVLCGKLVTFEDEEFEEAEKAGTEFVKNVDLKQVAESVRILFPHCRKRDKQGVVNNRLTFVLDEESKVKDVTYS